MSTALERRWFAAVASLMAVWIALAAIGCVVGLFLQAGAWIRTHASWEAGAALLVLTLIVVAALTYRPPSRINGGIWTATVRPLPWPETGPGLIVRPVTHFARTGR